MVMVWVWMDGPPLGRACGAVVGPRTDPAGPTDVGRTPTGLLPLDGPTQDHPPRDRFPKRDGRGRCDMAALDACVAHNGNADREMGDTRGETGCPPRAKMGTTNRVTYGWVYG